MTEHNCVASLVHADVNFLVYSDGSLVVQDNKDPPDTYVNDKRVLRTLPKSLKHGDKVKLGINPEAGQQPSYTFEVSYLKSASSDSDEELLRETQQRTKSRTPSSALESVTGSVINIRASYSTDEQSEPLRKNTSDRLITDEVTLPNESVLEKDEREYIESSPSTSFNFRPSVKKTPPIINPHAENRSSIQKRRTASRSNSQENRREKLKEIKSLEGKETGLKRKHSAVKVKEGYSRGKCLLEDNGPPAKKPTEVNKKTLSKSSDHPMISRTVVDLNEQLENAAVPTDNSVNNSTLPRQMSIPKNLEEEVWGVIIYWNVDWLEEQKKIPFPPLKDSSRMCKNFSSYDDYRSVVVPLLKLELWSALCNNWKTKSKTDSWKEVTIKSTSREQVSGNYCDLTCTIAELQAVSQDYRIVFTLRTKRLKCEIKGGHIRVIPSMMPYLRLFKSVKYLEQSALCPLVVEPRIKDYAIPEITHNKMVTKTNLNKNQEKAVKEAVSFCLSDRPGIYLVEGPPGTGKSTVIMTIIEEILFTKRNAKPCILLVAPSNVAVDELVRRLMNLRLKMPAENDKKFNFVRVGLPTLIHSDVYQCSLDHLTRKRLPQLLRDQCFYPETTKKLNDKQETIEILIGRLKERGWDTTEQERKLKNEIEDFDKIGKQELRSKRFWEFWERAEKSVLRDAHVICTTLSGCIHPKIKERFKNRKLTCCIVDEATQSSEQETLIPLMLDIEKLILVGDPKQLPASTRSIEAKELGYGKSLFSRIKDNFENGSRNPIVMLRMQYRMHPEIASFPNRTYYGSCLGNSDSCSVVISSLKPYIVFDMSEWQYQDCYEIDLIVKLIQCIVKVSYKNLDIGIITSWNSQDKIKEGLRANSFRRGILITVNTIENFQGQEKDIIILPCVNVKANNFVNDNNRMNVALTRARYALYIVGSTYSFNASDVLRSIAEDADKRRVLFKVKNLNPAYLKQAIMR